MSMKPSTLYTTFPDAQTANKAARTLIDKRLIACANIIKDVTTFYRWEGNVCEENECILIGKTSLAVSPQIISELKILHPYDEPAIVFLPVTDGSASYVHWIQEQLGAYKETHECIN